jgi:hypothetical protein
LDYLNAYRTQLKQENITKYIDQANAESWSNSLICARALAYSALGDGAV